MKSEAGVPVAYAVHAYPERFTQFLGAEVSVAAGLPTARNTAGNRIPAIAEVWLESSRVQQPVAQIPRGARICGVSVTQNGSGRRSKDARRLLGPGV